jgi:hypothetical protein
MTQDDAAGLLDRLAIRELVDNWMMWRDARIWEPIPALFHEGGRLMTTWGGQSTQDEFAVAAQAGFERGDRMLHSNGGTTVEVVGHRGVSQTKLRIMQRGVLEGVLCDVTCIGRDYDFVEKRDGRWGFILRQPIYERDFVEPVDPSLSVHLDQERLARYPEGYARLAYLQESLGYRIIPTMPVHTGPDLEALYEQGAAWLRGENLSWPPPTWSASS